MKKLIALATVIAAFAGTSALAEDNYHGSACQWEHMASGVTQYLSSYSLFVQNNSSYSLDIICPVTVLQSIGHTASQVDDVDLYGSNINNARFCIRANIQGGESCGSAKTGNGPLDLPHPSISGFVNESMYIKMEVPAGSYTYVKGYEVDY